MYISSKFRLSLIIVCSIVVLWIILFPKITVAQGKLFLLAGQSNAVGQGDSLKSVICQEGTAFEFDAISNDFVTLKDPVGKNWRLFQHAQSGSIAPSFANSIYLLTHQPVYMVTAARGGASCHQKAELSNYQTWSASGVLTADAIDKTRMAMTKANLELSGIIWIQGERDANAILAGQLTGDEYQEALEDVIQRFRLALGEKVPFFIVLTAYQQDKDRLGCRTVRERQEQVSHKLKSVYVVYPETDTFANKGWFKDVVHYNQEALNDIGAKSAQSVVAILNKNH